MIVDENDYILFTDDYKAEQYFKYGAKDELRNILLKLNISLESNLLEANSLDIIVYIETFIKRHKIEPSLKESIEKEIKFIKKNLVKIYKTFKAKKHFGLVGKPVVREGKLTPSKEVDKSKLVILENSIRERLSQNEERHIFGADIAGQQRCK